MFILQICRLMDTYGDDFELLSMLWFQWNAFESSLPKCFGDVSIKQLYLNNIAVTATIPSKLWYRIF